MRIPRLVIIGVAITVAVHRAVTQPVTFDEAWSFVEFCRGEWGRTFAPSSNNHLLNTLLMRLTTGAVGASAFTLRIPTLVACCVSLAFVWRWTRRLAGFPGILALAAFAFDPILSDYFALARGYGIATAMLLWLADALGRVGSGFSASSTPRRALVETGLAAAGCACASLTFVPSVVAVIAAAVVLAWRARDRWTAADLGAVAVWAGVPALAAGAVPLWFALRIPRDQLYYGAATMAESGTSLMVRMLARPRGEPCGALSDLGGPLVITVAIAICASALAVAVGAAVIDLCRSRERVLDATERSGIIVGLGAGFAVAATFGSSALASLPYPSDRTGLHLIVLTVLGVGSACARSVGSERSIRRLAAAAIRAGVVVFSFASYSIGPFSGWEIDTRCGDGLRFLESQWQPGTPPVRVLAAPEVWGPCLEFERVTRRLDWLAPVDRTARLPIYDYLVLTPRYVAIAWIRELVEPVWQTPDGSVVIVRVDKKKLGAETR